MKKLFASFFVLMLTLNFCACGGSDSGSDDGNQVTYYSIQGKVTLNGNGLSHVSVKLEGWSARNTVITDDTGNFIFENLNNGEYTITPIPSGYTFDSNSADYEKYGEYIEVTLNGSNLTDLDFTAAKNSGVNAYLHYTFPDQTHFLDNYPGKNNSDVASILFSGYNLTDGIQYDLTNTVSGYNVEQFVDQATVNAVTYDPDAVLGTNDARELYCYVVVSNDDGFDNRTKFANTTKMMYNYDLRWDQFIQFYLLTRTYSAKVHSPFSQSAGGTLYINMYNNKWAHDIYMFRKIDVKRPDTAGTIATFEVGATTTNYVDDSGFTAASGTFNLTTTKFNVTTISFTDGSTSYSNVKAISLDQFITSYVVADPTNANYSYTIIGLSDGSSRTGWTWTNMQQAYYLPDYDFICQVSGGALIAGTKINFPERIEVVTTDTGTITAADTYYTNNIKSLKVNPPAYASYE